MWNVVGNPVEPDWLVFEPVRVLYRFDGPRIFTLNDKAGNLFLAYLCGEEPDLMRFLVVPFSKEQETRLTTGQIDLRDVLTGGKAWLVDVDYQWTPSGMWQIEMNNLPLHCLPDHGVMLWQHLYPAGEPAAKATGESKTPAGPLPRKAPHIDVQQVK